MATPNQSERISALRTAPGGTPADAVLGYSLAEDQSKVVLSVGGSAITGLRYVSTASPGNELPLNQPLDSAATIEAIIVRFGSANRVAYTVQAAVPPSGTFISEINATPNPRPIGLAGSPGSVVEAIRPDGQAVVLRPISGPGFVEVLVDSAQPPTVIGTTEENFNMRYDDRGDALITQVFHSVGNLYLTVAAAVRPNFGTDQQVGTPGLAALFTSFSGTDRAISVIGEGPKVQPVPPVQSARLALANAWAPDKLLYVTDLLTSRNQKGSRATLVDP
jgi:hypothetical protein